MAAVPGAPAGLAAGAAGALAAPPPEPCACTAGGFELGCVRFAGVPDCAKTEVPVTAARAASYARA